MFRPIRPSSDALKLVKGTAAASYAVNIYTHHATGTSPQEYTTHAAHKKRNYWYWGLFLRG
jgi:hypothetical protein